MMEYETGFPALRNKYINNIIEKGIDRND